MLRPTSVIASVLLMATAMLILPPSPPTLVRAELTTTSGTPLANLFTDQPRVRQDSKPTKAGGACGKVPSLLSRVVGLLSPVAVQAFSCGSEGSCGSHYMYNLGPTCGGSICTWSNYDKYRSDSMQASFCEGFKPMGVSDCDGCVCKEESCDSCNP
jgi:hypothetical protein